MAFHKCRNEGCEVQIEVRNTAEGWRPFEESGNMHQCQYSEYAKKQRAYQHEQEKNNHGYESFQDIKQDALGTPKNNFVDTKAESPKQMYERYVDHTLVQPPKLKLKILTSTEAEGLSLLYNTFGETHTIRFSQYQIAGSLYTIAVFFEEIPLKQ